MLYNILIEEDISGHYPTWMVSIQEYNVSTNKTKTIISNSFMELTEALRWSKREILKYTLS